MFKSFTAGQLLHLLGVLPSSDHFACCCGASSPQQAKCVLPETYEFDRHRWGYLSQLSLGECIWMQGEARGACDMVRCSRCDVAGVWDWRCVLLCARGALCGVCVCVRERVQRTPFGVLVWWRLYWRTSQVHPVWGDWRTRESRCCFQGREELSATFFAGRSCVGILKEHVADVSCVSKLFHSVGAWKRTVLVPGPFPRRNLHAQRRWVVAVVVGGQAFVSCAASRDCNAVVLLASPEAHKWGHISKRDGVWRRFAHQSCQLCWHEKCLCPNTHHSNKKKHHKRLKGTVQKKKKTKTRKQTASNNTNRRLTITQPRYPNHTYPPKLVLDRLVPRRLGIFPFVVTTTSPFFRRYLRHNTTPNRLASSQKTVDSGV